MRAAQFQASQFSLLARKRIPAGFWPRHSPACHCMQSRISLYCLHHQFPVGKLRIGLRTPYHCRQGKSALSKMVQSEGQQRRLRLYRKRDIGPILELNRRCTLPARTGGSLMPGTVRGLRQGRSDECFNPKYRSMRAIPAALSTFALG